MCRAANELNGNVVSEFDTGDIVFGIAKTIAEITRSTTLVPGDMSRWRSRASARCATPCAARAGSRAGVA